MGVNKKMLSDLFGIDKSKEKNVVKKSLCDYFEEENLTPHTDCRNYLDHKAAFLEIFNQFIPRYRFWDIWKDFIIMFACSISNSVDLERREERELIYLKTIKKYNKKEQVLFPELVAETVMALDDNVEQDFLGMIFMSLNLGSDAGGQFFTPYSVCQLMAKLAFGDVRKKVKENGFITLNDCACGAGATLIAGINESKEELSKDGLNFQNHVLVVAQDIDYTTALMCYIQLSLLGVAGYVKVGDSLTEPIRESDSLDNYWFTPIYFSNIWAIRRVFRGDDFVKL